MIMIALQVNENIYAVGTYSCLVLSIVIFLITDYLRYKPLIIADGIAGIFTYVLLLGQPSLKTIQVRFFKFLCLFYIIPFAVARKFIYSN